MYHKVKVGHSQIEENGVKRKNSVFLAMGETFGDVENQTTKFLIENPTYENGKIKGIMPTSLAGVHLNADGGDYFYEIVAKRCELTEKENKIFFNDTFLIEGDSTKEVLSIFDKNFGNLDDYEVISTKRTIICGVVQTSYEKADKKEEVVEESKEEMF